MKTGVRWGTLKGLTGDRVPLTLSRIEKVCLLLRRMRAFCRLPCTAIEKHHHQSEGSGGCLHRAMCLFVLNIKLARP